MLALVIGVFSLSQLTIVARTVAGRFQQTLVDNAGGNVIVWVAANQANTLERVKTRLAGTEGVHSYSIGSVYDVELLSLYDTSEGETITWDELLQRKDVDVGWPPGGDSDELMEAVSGIDGREVNSNLPDVPFYKGRQLTAADAGQPHIVVTANAATLAAGFDVGDKLTFRLQHIQPAEQPKQEGTVESTEITLEIVGMIDRTDEMISIGVLSPNYAPLDVFPAHIPPEKIGAIVDIEQDQIGALRRALNDTPGVFLIETHYLNDVINRATAQFATFPILIAALALFTGGVVIANSVALSTRERQREIGIMKAIGLQRERVLGMLLLEHSLMGTISGLIGIGISGGASLVVLRVLFGKGVSSVFPIPTTLGLMALCVIVAVLAAIVTVWGASGEKPLHVLRYE
jgi:hypothetical protein